LTFNPLGCNLLSQFHYISPVSTEFQYPLWFVSFLPQALTNPGTYHKLNKNSSLIAYLIIVDTGFIAHRADSCHLKQRLVVWTLHSLLLSQTTRWNIKLRLCSLFALTPHKYCSINTVNTCTKNKPDRTMRHVCSGKNKRDTRGRQTYSSYNSWSSLLIFGHNTLHRNTHRLASAFSDLCPNVQMAALY